MDSNHRCLDVGQESSPLDHGTIAVAEVGIEPTISHQALDLAALPVCVLGRMVRHSCLTSQTGMSDPPIPDPGLAPDGGAYEALLSTCPSGPSDQGESRTPTLAVERGLLRTVCLPIPPLGQAVVRRGVEPLWPA